MNFEHMNAIQRRLHNAACVLGADGDEHGFEQLQRDAIAEIEHLREAEHIQFARAILALRPERVPMTDEQISLEAHNADDRDWNDLRFRSSWHEGFLEGARFAEAHHGITAQCVNTTKKGGAA